MKGDIGDKIQVCHYPIEGDTFKGLNGSSGPLTWKSIQSWLNRSIFQDKRRVMVLVKLQSHRTSDQN